MMPPDEPRPYRQPFAHTFQVIQDEYSRLWLFSPALAVIMADEYETRKEGKRPRLNSNAQFYLDIILDEYPDKLREKIINVALNLNALLVQYERHSSPAVKYLAISQGLEDEWVRVPRRP